MTHPDEEWPEQEVDRENIEAIEQANYIDPEFYE